VEEPLQLDTSEPVPVRIHSEKGGRTRSQEGDGAEAGAGARSVSTLTVIVTLRACELASAPRGFFSVFSETAVLPLPLPLSDPIVSRCSFSCLKDHRILHFRQCRM